MSGAKSRLANVVNVITSSISPRKQDPNQIPWDPNNEEFPALKDLAKIEGAPEGAAWVWGKDDFLGRINLLTPARVKVASAEIRSGEIIPVNLPVDEPNPPAFHRKPFEHKIVSLAPTAFDDEYVLNTQSSTQWDGFRHVGHPSGLFYNGISHSTISQTSLHASTPCHPAGIHHIAQHGISARAIVLDYHTWSQQINPSASIDPFTRTAIPLSNLLACATAQGLNLTPASRGGNVKPGDILLIRIGFTAKYRSLSRSKWEPFARRPQNEQFWAGIDGGSDELREWVHDCYFAAIASDAPALEMWPPVDPNKALHTSMLPLWGMMIGEFFDLDRVAERCREEKRWTVFFTSAPQNVKGGVGSWVNGLVIM